MELLFSSTCGMTKLLQAILLSLPPSPPSPFLSFLIMSLFLYSQWCGVTLVSKALSFYIRADLILILKE